MGLALILFIGGAVIFAWLFFWSRQRQRLGSTPAVEQVLQSVPSASGDDAVLVSREHGQVVYANERARHWLNMNGGNPNLEYVAQLAQPSDSFLELFAKEGQSSFQLGMRWVEASSHRIPTGNETRTVVVMRELGANTYNPEALDLSLAMSIINEIGETVNASLSVEQVLQALLTILRNAVPADAGEICIWDEQSQVLYPRGWVGDATYVLSLSEVGGMYRLSEGITGWIARNRKPLLVSDVADPTAIPPKLTNAPYKSYVGVPLSLGDKFIGTFELSSVEAEHFSQRDMALLQAVSKQLATSIYNAQLYTEQTRHIDDMASLQQVMHQTSDDYVRAVYGDLTQRLAKLVGADMCGILLYNEARQMLVAELPFYGVPDQVTRNYQISLPNGSPQREVWENQQYWISNDVADEPLIELLGLMPLVNVTGVYNTLLLPMLVGEKRIGTVQVSNKRTEGGFTLRDVQNLRILTAQAAVVVENTRLYQREESRETEFIGLQEITKAIGAFSREEEFYRVLNDSIARLMGVSMCGILLYEEDNNRLVAKLPFHGVDDAAIQNYEISLKPGSILYDIWLEVDYWMTNNMRSDRLVIEAGLEDFAAAIGVKQTMMAPLALGERRIGVVQVSNKLNGENFTDKDARLLTIFATQAAALIENARLYREMQRRASEAEGLRDAAEELRRIAELAGSIITPEESLTPVLAEVGRLTDSPLVFVNVLEQGSSNLVTYPRYVYGVELDEPIVQDSYTPGFDKSVALSQRPFISNNVATDERVLFSYRFIAKKVGIETAMLVPLAVGDRSLGELGIANRTSRPYTQDDLKLVMSIAIQISATLDRVTLYESAGQNLNQRVQELDAISRVSNELTLTLDLDRILDVIRQEAARATGADGSTVALLKPSSQWADPTIPEMSRRLGSEKISDKLTEIELEAAAGTVNAVLVADYAETTIERLPENARSAVAASFLFADEIVGVIHLYHSEANHFDGRASEFLMTLASKASLGYANAIRYDEQLARNAQLRRRVEQLNQIFELGQMLQSKTDPVTMLEAIAYSIQHSVGYDVVVMLLADEDGSALRRVAQAGLPLDVFEQSKEHTLKRLHLDALLTEEYHISESYFFPEERRADWRRFGDFTALGTAFEGKRVVTNGRSDSWHEGDLFIVPLSSSTGTLLGLIVLDGPQDNQRPNRGLIEVLEIFAHHASATIENTRLYLGSISSAEQEARLNVVLEAATSTLDVEEVLKAIASGVFQLARFNQMTAALLDEDQGFFDVYKLEVESEEKIVIKQETWSSLQFTALGRTVDTGQDYLYHAQDKEVEQFNDLRGYCEGDGWVAIVLPLAAAGLRVGALLVAGDIAPDVRVRELRNLVKRMANIASIAIENARLFTDAVNLRLFNESVVQSIQQGIVVLDKSGRIMSVNTFMSQRYGWESDQAVGQDLFAYRPELVPVLLGDVRTALETGLPQERIGQRSNIDERPLVRNFYAYPLGDSSNIRGVVLMVEDVTERARLEHDLEARANQLSVLTEVSSRITASLDHTEVVALALSEMHRIVTYDTMTFWLRDGDYIILEAAKDYEDDTMPIGVNVKIDSHARISQVVKTQKVFSISRLQGWDKLPGESGAQSWMGVPLVNQGNVVGVIAFTKIEPSFYDAQAEQAAFAFANQVAVALANADLFREAEHRTQRLSLLNRVSVALVQSLDSEDILEIALREISQVLQVEHARALIFERDVQMGRVVVEHPRGDTPPDQIIDLKDSPSYQQIRRTVKSLIVDDLVNLQGMDEIKNELLPRNITAYALIPMAIGGQVIGAFELEMLSTPRRFNPEQTDLGRIIANQAAIAIQNTSLLEQTLVRSRELETLLEAAQATSVTLDLQEVFRSVVELMMHALEMDDCSLMMWDDVDRTVEVQVDANRMGDESRILPPGTVISLADYPAKLRALEKREVIIINHESKEWYPKEYDELTNSGINAQMLVPLIVRDRVIGLVQMELISDYRTFTHREIRLAQALGAQAATAIENARLSTETSSRVEELYIINDLSQTVSATINIQEMIEVVRDRLPSIAHTEELYLALYDSETKIISFPLAIRNRGAYEIPPRELNNDEISYIIKNRRLLTIGSDYFSTDELRRSLGISPGEGDVKSYMGVPLISGDEVVGVLALRDTTRTRAFGVNTSGILSTIASQLGASIQNARLFNKLNTLNKNLEQSVQNRTAELLEERDRIDTLYRITSELARTLDLERVLSRALEMVAGAVNAQDGVIFQIDPTTDKLHSRATLSQETFNDHGERINSAHPAEKLAEWLIQNQSERVVVVDDLLKMDFWDDTLLLDVEKWRSALAVLLEINDDIHGVMILFGRKRGVFTEPQVRLVVAAANQVAAAINNSDLYYLIRDQAERLGMLVLSEQEEAEKSNAILEGIADGVMLANAKGHIIRFNSAAERILELPRDNVLGQPLSKLSGLQGGSANWMRMIDEWSQSPESYRPGIFESEQLELGKKIINVRLSPVHIDNQFLGTVLVFRDITKEVEVDRLKSEFISNVSHELRTPLTPIKGFTDLMLLGAAGQISSQQEYFLKTIKSHTQRLETLVNDLLNISKLDDTKETLKFETVNVPEIMESVVKTVGGKADHEQKELKVTIDIPQDFPAISGDSGKLTQIFNNLVDNAFNYTYAGGSIDIQGRVQDDHVLVTVKDTGIGIPPEFRERIWERFVRNDEHALVMDVAGTGLGLPIVKKLVQMHGGEVWFESEPNVGTTFFVSLPINQPTSN